MESVPICPPPGRATPGPGATPSFHTTAWPFVIETESTRLESRICDSVLPVRPAKAAISDASAAEITITDPSSPEIASRLPLGVNETWITRLPRVATGGPTGSSVFASRSATSLPPTSAILFPSGLA